MGDEKMAGRIYHEPASDIEVYAECDVLVVGAGAAGHSAAVAAARAGCRDVILMERYGYSGGDVTGDYVLMVPKLTRSAQKPPRRHSPRRFRSVGQSVYFSRFT